MKLLDTAIEQGEYAAGKTFDQAALDQLRLDGQTFGQLSTASAGQRVTDDSINRPFDLLRARFEALVLETAEFDGRAASLLSLLEKDSALIDQLLFAAGVEFWASKQPQVGASQDVKWDFGMGHGSVASDVPVTDPENGVEYPSRPAVATCLTDVVRTGLVAPSEVRSVPVKYVKWHFTSTGSVEELYGPAWTKLSMLEATPLVAYSGNPAVDPYNHPFLISGRSLMGGTPVYVRVQFTPRRNQVTRTVTNHESFALSGYEVSTDDVVVMHDGTLYQEVTDYTIDPNGTFTPLNLPGTPVTIWFVEHFPSYQCSINQREWSPVIMLDPTRPYPDTETQFHPLTCGPTSDGTRSALPITDELGTPTGMFIQLSSRRPTDDWLLKISNPGNADIVGATAILEIEFARPMYLNALQVAPFTTFPLTLARIEVEGLTTDTRHSVYEGTASIDRSTVLRFDRTLVRRAYLTVHQEHYTLKEYTLESPDALRREVMTGLQAVLPYAARRSSAPLPVKKRGALYEFGLESLEGQDWVLTKGLFVSGPHRFSGCPEIIRVDVDLHGTVDFYLYYRAFNASGLKVDENIVGVALVPGTTIVFPFAEDLDRGFVHHTDIYLKMVHRTTDAVVERFLIQVANV